MLDLDIFDKKLETHRGIYLNNIIVFRTISTNLIMDNIIKSPLDSKYSYDHGYRFNYPENYPILYLGMSTLVTSLETQQRLDPFSNPIFNSIIKPTTTYSIKISGHFADLTNKKSLKSFAMNQNHPEYLIPTKEWEKHVDAYHQFGIKDDPAITHFIGDSIYESKFDGFIYYSYPAWHIKDTYKQRFVYSGLCVFMDKDDFCKPRNPNCKLEVMS